MKVEEEVESAVKKIHNSSKGPRQVPIIFHLDKPIRCKKHLHEVTKIFSRLPCLSIALQSLHIDLKHKWVGNIICGLLCCKCYKRISCSYFLLRLLNIKKDMLSQGVAVFAVWHWSMQVTGPRVPQWLRRERGIQWPVQFPTINEVSMILEYAKACSMNKPVRKIKNLKSASSKIISYRSGKLLEKLDEDPHFRVGVK